MKKTLCTVLCISLLSGILFFCGCSGNDQPSAGEFPDSQNGTADNTVGSTEPAYDEQTVVSSSVPEGAYSSPVYLEGEEYQISFVRYDSPLGYSMDCPYSEFVLSSDGSREVFRWHFDDATAPSNYITAEAVTDNAQTTADRLEQELYYDYYTVSRVDAYTVNDCSDAVKLLCDSPTEESGLSYDIISEYYIIPSGDGCFVVSVNYTWESTEGAYQYMLAALNTFTVS